MLYVSTACPSSKVKKVIVFFYYYFDEVYAPIEFIAISFSILDIFSIKRRNTTYKQLSKLKQ